MKERSHAANPVRTTVANTSCVGVNPISENWTLSL